MLAACAVAAVVASAAILAFYQEAGPAGEANYRMELRTAQQIFTGFGAENTDMQYNVTIGETDVSVVQCELQWWDEPSVRSGYVNLPDELGINLTAPDGSSRNESAGNPQGGEGQVAVAFDMHVNETAASRRASTLGRGVWTLVVHIGDCGEQHRSGSLISYVDTGNAYTLTFEYSYYARVRVD